MPGAAARGRRAGGPHYGVVVDSVNVTVPL
jgi:hypothetical protein